jgi:hypothetical protein
VADLTAGRRLARQVRTRWRRPDEVARATAPAPTEAERRYVLRVLQTVLAVVVLGERITLPLGSFPIGLPLVAGFAGLVALRLRGAIGYNRVRAELYLAAAALVVAAAWGASWLGSDVSVTSLLLLLVLYAPWVFCLPGRYRPLIRPLLMSFVRMMLPVAAVGTGQMALQLLHVWSYRDYLAQLLPADLLAQNYNTSYPVTYLSPIYKANAFVFLEPSFLSQFCALALVVSLLLRAPAWQPLLLGIGMAATLSGTGILLLVVGVALLTVRTPNRIRPAYVLAGVIGLLVVFSTPAGQLLLDRRSETSQQGSSGYIRFVQPYTAVSSALAEHPSRYLVGAGAGASDRLLPSFRSGGEAVVYTIAPKTAFEYGLIAAVAFIAFLLVAVLRGPPVPVLPACVVVMIFFLSGSLLQPHTVMTAWLLTSLWGRPATVGLTDALAARRRAAEPRQPPARIVLPEKTRIDIT